MELVMDVRLDYATSYLHYSKQSSTAYAIREMGGGEEFRLRIAPS